jgi:hypothetical protein
MTAFELQDDLIEELDLVFTGIQLTTPKLDEVGTAIISAIKIFAQSLPIRSDDEEDDPFPYIIVRIDSGDMRAGSAHLVKVRVIIGLFDDKNDTNGHKDVLNVIQKIYERFAKNPVLANKYVMQDSSENPFTWVLQDEDTHPYYFGAIDITWETMAIRRESQYT